MNIAPCKDCTDRVLGCHSHCKKYLSYTEENERRKEAHRKECNEYASIMESHLRIVKEYNRHKRH